MVELRSQQMKEIKGTIIKWKKKKKKTGADVVDVAHQVFCKIYYKTSIIRYILYRLEDVVYGASF